VQELDRWLQDLVREGIAGARSKPFSFWDGVSARMVDAQAPGLASQVRRLAATAYSPDDWPSHLLERAARLRLVTAAWPRFEQLPADVQADLRTVVGWTYPADDVLAGPTIRSQWAVVGQVTREEERLRVRRSWLWSNELHRAALLLEFVPVGGAFTLDLVVGTTLDAELAFYPGSVPIRALIAGQFGPITPVTDLAGFATIGEAVDCWSTALAANPWLDRLLVVLNDVVPTTDGQLADRHRVALPMGDQPPWKLLAISGGAPITIVAEWDGRQLAVLSATTDGRLIPV
jgi:hypothetical protein